MKSCLHLRPDGVGWLQRYEKILSDIKFILWKLILDSSTLFLSNTICTWVQVYNLCIGIPDMLIRIRIAKLVITNVDIIII